MGWERGGQQRWVGICLDFDRQWPLDSHQLCVPTHPSLRLTGLGKADHKLGWVIQKAWLF